jgi:hypothetical protein
MIADRRGPGSRCGRWRGLLIASLIAWPLPCIAQSAPAAPATSDEPAKANVSDERIVAARDAFSLGATLARQGQWVDALGAFERSYRLHTHSTTLFNIGFCERALGRFTRARKSFRGALAAGTSTAAPGLNEELAREAQGYLDEIERRIVRATIVIRQPRLRITINGRPLEAENSQPPGRTFFVAGTRDAGPAEAPPVAVFELLIDPGEQSIVVSTDGVDRVITRTFEAGSAPRIELSAPASPLTPMRPPQRHLLLPAIAYGVGAAGVVVGTVFGVATLENTKQLSQRCPQKTACPEDVREELDASKRNALISEVGFGVAVVGGVVGTWLLFSSQPKETPDAHVASPLVRARVGIGNVNVEGSF